MIIIQVSNYKIVSDQVLTSSEKLKVYKNFQPSKIPQCDSLISMEPREFNLKDKTRTLLSESPPPSLCPTLHGWKKFSPSLGMGMPSHILSTPCLRAEPYAQTPEVLLLLFSPPIIGIEFPLGNWPSNYRTLVLLLKALFGYALPQCFFPFSDWEIVGTGSIPLDPMRGATCWRQQSHLLILDYQILNQYMKKKLTLSCLCHGTLETHFATVGSVPYILNNEGTACIGLMHWLDALYCTILQKSYIHLFSVCLFAF